MLDVSLKGGGERQIPVRRPDDDLVCIGELLREIEDVVLEHAAPRKLRAKRHLALAERKQVHLLEIHLANQRTRTLSRAQIAAAQHQRARSLASDARVHEQYHYLLPRTCAIETGVQPQVNATFSIKQSERTMAFARIIAY